MNNPDYNNPIWELHERSIQKANEDGYRTGYAHGRADRTSENTVRTLKEYKESTQTLDEMLANYESSADRRARIRRAKRCRETARETVPTDCPF